MISSKRNILVTGIGGDIGQNIIKCLKDTTYTFNLSGCDVDLFAAGKKQVEKFYQSPRGKETKEYQAFIQRLIKIDGIIIS